jgi:hypothetical protein
MELAATWTEKFAQFENFQETLQTTSDVAVIASKSH